VTTILPRLLLALLLLGSGCAKPNPTGTVAVADLDKVASALGWQEEITKALQTAEEERRAQLQAVAQSAAAAIETAKNEVIADAKLNADQIKLLNTIQDPRDLDKLPLTDAQRTKLIQAVNQANLTLQNAQLRSQQALQEKRTALIQRYRDRIRPVAQQIATAAGMQIVLIADNSVLYHEPAVDLTDRITEKLRAETTGPAPFVTPSTK